MIHLTTFNRDAAIDFANQLTRREGGPKVKVYIKPELYTAEKDAGYLVLDVAGFLVEGTKSPGLAVTYDPERRAHPRAPFRTFVAGAVFKKRVANA